MKKNVLLLVEDLKMGGQERIIEKIAANLDKTQFNVKVWCLCNGGDIYDEIKDAGIETDILSMISHRDIFFFLKFCGKLKKHNIDIIHTHGYTADTIGRLAAFVARVPIILSHLHTTPVNYSKKQLFIERALSFISTKIICCSKAAADFLTGNSGIRPDKTAVIYNGVDIGLFSKINPVSKSKKNEYLVGSVASLTPHKGHRYLIEAAEIVKNNLNSNVNFLFVGEGILLEELKQYAKKLGVDDIVIFHGIEPDVPCLLYSLDIKILASTEREGLPVSVAEAMAAGKAVIGTNVGGTPEVIEDGVNGVVVPPKDSKALANAIISILNDERKAEKMGKHGREIAEEKFSLKEMMKKIESLYIELLKK